MATEDKNCTKNARAKGRAEEPVQKIRFLRRSNKKEGVTKSPLSFIIIRGTNESELPDDEFIRAKPSENFATSVHENQKKKKRPCGFYTTIYL